MELKPVSQIYFLMSRDLKLDIENVSRVKVAKPSISQFEASFQLYSLWIRCLKDNIFEGDNWFLIKLFQMTDNNIIWKAQASFKSKVPKGNGSNYYRR